MDDSDSGLSTKQWLVIAAVSVFVLFGMCTVLLASNTEPSTDHDPLILETAGRTGQQTIASHPAWVLSLLRLIKEEQYDQELRGNPVYVSGTICDIQGHRVYLYAPLLNPEIADLSVAGCDRWRVSVNGLSQNTVSGLNKEDELEVICRVPISNSNDDRRTTFLEACTVPNEATAANFATTTPTITPIPTATPEPVRLELSGSGQDVQIVDLPNLGNYFVTTYVLNNQTCLGVVGCTPAHFGVTMQHEFGSELGIGPKILANEVADNWQGRTLLHLDISSGLVFGNYFVSVSAANDAEWHIVIEEVVDADGEQSSDAISTSGSVGENSARSAPQSGFIAGTPTIVASPIPTPEPVVLTLSGTGRGERTIELSEGSYIVTFTVRDNYSSCESDGRYSTCLGGYFAADIRSLEEGLTGYLVLAQEYGTLSYWSGSKSIEVGSFGRDILPPGEMMIGVAAEEGGQWEVIIEST